MLSLLNIMSSLASNKVRLFIAGLISLFAQVLLFAPVSQGPLPGEFPAQGNLAPGAVFAALSMFLFIRVIRSHPFSRGANRLLFALQAVTVIGLYFLLDGSASRAREAGLLLSGFVTVLTVYGIFVNLSSKAVGSPEGGEGRRLDVSISDYDATVNVLKEKLASATRQLNAEKRRTAQLTFLTELSQQLETELDPPVAARLAVNTLERALDCSLVSLMLYEAESHEFVALATAGRMTSIIPPGYRQDAGIGLLGRAARLKKTQVVNDAGADSDFISINDKNTLSVIVVPILQYGQIKGVMEICSEKPYAFNGMDAAIAEGIALELTRAWERSSYNQRLAELIQAGISLTTLLDPQAAVQEIAVLARKTLEARFVFITLLDQQGNFSRTAYAGNAPKLLNSLNENPSDEPLLQAALNAAKPFRIRDLRKYAGGGKLEIDNSSLRGALAMPIRLHRLSIGAVIAFGKQEGVFFTENDESLADLLASQAAASIESSWLYQELRNTLNVTSMLYQLSVDVIQAEELSNAAELIAQAAHRATNARETGIVLLGDDGEIQAEVELDANGFHTRREHPLATITQAIQTGQSIFVSAESGSLVCYPLLTRARTVGALWMNIPESRGQNFANIQTLANQAAVTLERSILLSESRRQAKAIEAAYEELQQTYDQTLSALMSALDARDRETEGHSMRVSRIACMLGEKIGLNGSQLKALERGALLHDIGKIGISDTILHKPGKLTEDEWRIMRVHPDIGARIIERIPFLQECLPVVRYHHERWDGSGYPLGLKRKEIPIQARIFAVADVFDALTSKRSYRNKSSAGDAIKYLRQQSDILFDPQIVDALTTLPYAEFTEGAWTAA
jgi:putative nucleotidyltransferase with HDIG domain